MKEYVIKTHNISKTFHNANALLDVSIALEPGRIYGLIGQNGAGKSTLMRIIAGLSFATSGTITLFGQEKEQAVTKERKRIGCMVEYPSMIPYLSAKENLTHYRILKGIPNQELDDELLELVGLAHTGKKKAGNFSLGMKQRLGIAITLVGNPELLLLDEPINGLDPIGVVEIRTLLKKLCEEKHMTILISSHNLPELYQTATDYIIIHQGKVRKKLTLTDLEENCRHYIRIRCKQPEILTSVIESKLHTHNYKVMPDQSIKLYDHLNDIDKVATILFENGIIITGLAIQGDTLENYFVSLIGGDEND